MKKIHVCIKLPETIREAVQIYSKPKLVELANRAYVIDMQAKIRHDALRGMCAFGCKNPRRPDGKYPRLHRHMIKHAS